MSKKYGLNPTIPVCFWCGKQKNEIALLGKIGKGKEDIEAPMYCVLNYDPCDECTNYRRQGVTLIEVTTRSPQENLPPIQDGLYPTSRWSVIKKEAAERMFSGYLNDRNLLLIDDELYDQILGGNERAS